MVKNPRLRTSGVGEITVSAPQVVLQGRSRQFHFLILHLKGSSGCESAGF